MATVDYIDKLYGGVDSRKTYDEEGKVIYWDSSKNVCIDGKTIKKCLGQTSKVQNSGYACLGLGEYERNGVYFSRAIFSDGKYYNLDEVNGSLSPARKTGLSIDSKPYFTQYKDKIVVLTGKDDPFLDNETITQTTFFDTTGVYGTCAEEFAGKLFIGSGKTLYWSATGDPTGWDYAGADANDAGFDANFLGDIVNLFKMGDYLIVYTTQAIYFWSGYDFKTFQKTHFSNIGIASKNNVCIFDEKHFVFNEFGFFQLEQTGDMAQLNSSLPLSYRVHQEMMEEIDKGRVDEIKLVAYEDKRQIWIYIPIKNQAGIYKCWVADFQNYYDSKVIAFYNREGNSITSAASLKNKIYTGTSTGKIYEEDKGYTFDGSVIDANCYITISMGDKAQQKSAEFLKIYAESLIVNDFKLELAYDGKYYNAVTKDITINHPYYIMDVTPLDTAPLGDGNDMLSLRQNNNIKRFTTVRLGFKATESVENFHLNGFSFFNVKKNRAII